MARHDKYDLVRILDKENNGVIAKIVDIEDWDFLGTNVKAYVVQAVDGEDPLVFDGVQRNSITYLDSMFEAV